MSLLGSVFSNKTIQNSALSALSGWMKKDGVSAVFITQSDEQDSETPGVAIKAYKEVVGLVSGDDLSEYLSFLKWKGAGAFLDQYFINESGRFEFSPEEKEAEDEL